jgi:hypothetical protein
MLNIAYIRGITRDCSYTINLGTMQFVRKKNIVFSYERRYL